MPVSFKLFHISPRIPPKLAFLTELAYNLWWTWNDEAISLFRRLDPELWEETNHNPVALLNKISQEKLLEAENNEGFIASMESVYSDYHRYLQNSNSWFKNQTVSPSDFLVAYFSAEYGLTECLPLYSGGLGILAGDMLKSASEMGIPLVGVGILYQKGYFRQLLDQEGWQQEAYPVADYSFLPIKQVKNKDNQPMMIPVEFPGRTVFVSIWEVRIGRNKLLLLDTNNEYNSQEDQDLTDYLYGGDSETRICQEIILGIGGVRALKAVGMNPTVYHMNEGHSAFLPFEVIRNIMEEKNLSFDEAKEIASSSCVFTTHTPVPAGTDYFPPELVKKYFEKYASKLGISVEEILNTGRINPEDKKEHLCMTVVALRLSNFANAVSRLHEKTSKQLWKAVWREAIPDEIPITHITNGISHKTWVASELTELFNRYLGPGWKESVEDKSIWKRVDLIPNDELWRTHERHRERLVAFVRARLKTQMQRYNLSLQEIEKLTDVLDPKALTIGFARRFVAYKRADLIFKDTERLSKILMNKEKPVQIIFAGKAHPKDNNGKEIIKKIIHICKNEPFRGKIVFIEDYDMNVAKYMVQGCDIWLNVPRRPLEASGTSGMKAAINGVVNVSILDGWWNEAYVPEAGWAIGRGETYGDENYGDFIECKFLFDILEKEVIPLFYERGGDMMPRKWIEKMKNSIKLFGPVFNSDRMIREYTEKFYIPCDLRRHRLIKNDFEKAKQLASWKKRLHSHWSEISILSVKTNLLDKELLVGDWADFEVKVKISNEINPEDIKCEIIYGQISLAGELLKTWKESIIFTEKTEENIIVFSGKIQCRASGTHGYIVRIIPSNEHISSFCEFPLVVYG